MAIRSDVRPRASVALTFKKLNLLPFTFGVVTGGDGELLTELWCCCFFLIEESFSRSLRTDGMSPRLTAEINCLSFESK